MAQYALCYSQNTCLDMGRVMVHKGLKIEEFSMNLWEFGHIKVGYHRKMTDTKRDSESSEKRLLACNRCMGMRVLCVSLTTAHKKRMWIYNSICIQNPHKTVFVHFRGAVCSIVSKMPWERKIRIVKETKHSSDNFWTINSLFMIIKHFISNRV